MVYVLNKNGQPIMPTERYGKVRRMLKSGKATVIRRCPFTIQLTYDIGKPETQPVSLGIDAGSKTIGVSATTKAKVLYEAEVTLRNDIVELLSTRSENRRARRSRKTRYRQPRFNNRAKHEGWLAPSVQQKIDTHLAVIRRIHEILPISDITVEVASFDLQRLKADLEGLKRPKGEEYQQGEQLGFWNAREYVLWRDNHLCQCCKGKSKDKVLEVHHRESRKTGGDAPNNLVTLCKTCHTGHHKGTVTLPESITKRGTSFRDAVFMGIMRWAFYDRLKELYPNVDKTYGYITKHTRISHILEKAHHIDARCISGNPNAVSDGTVYYQKKVRCHNRQIHKMSIGKGGYRKLNQAPKEVRGFRLFDKVLYRRQEYTVYGRRSSGFFDIRDMDGSKVNKGSISCKKLKLIEHQQSYVTGFRKIKTAV